MNAGVFNIDGSGPEHRATQELLPWYAADRLSNDDSQRVAHHLQHCLGCRRDLARERALLAAINDNDDYDDDVMLPGLDMDAALARLLPQLGAQDSSSTPGPPPAPSPPPQTAAATPLRAVVPWWRRAAANEQSWLRWAAAAQCVLIVGMAALLARPDAPDTPNAPDAPDYHALGNAAAPSGGNLVVMFDPSTTERQMRRILQSHSARVVDGPTVTDAYVLRVPDAERQRALEALRHEPAVRLAEALDDSGAQ